jgi:hypothetical protein
MRTRMTIEERNARKRKRQDRNIAQKLARKLCAAERNRGCTNAEGDYDWYVAEFLPLIAAERATGADPLHIPARVLRKFLAEFWEQEAGSYAKHVMTF